MRLGHVILHVILYVPDVTAAVAFYGRAFGLAERFTHESGQYAEMGTGQTALAFAAEAFVAGTCHEFRRQRATEQPPGCEIALVADDMHAAFQSAVAAGATPYVEPHAKPWGQTVAYVRDLNGFLVELCDEAAP